MEDYSGLYIKNGGMIKERDVYYHVSRYDFCIWWHKQYRHWWLGKCKDIGENAGYAYLNPDKSCPHEGKSSEWHKSGSDKTINGYIFYSGNVQYTMKVLI